MSAKVHLFIWCIKLLLLPASCQNSYLTCPSSYTANKPAILKITLRKADLGVCVLNATNVAFDIQRVGMSQETLCIQGFDKCSPVENSRGCRCTGNSTNEATYELVFTPRISRDENLNFSAQVDCFDDTLRPIQIISPEQNCRNIIIELPSTVAVTTPVQFPGAQADQACRLLNNRNLIFNHIITMITGLFLLYC